MGFLWVLNVILWKLIRLLKTNWDVHVLFIISAHLPLAMFWGDVPVPCPRAIRIFKMVNVGLSFLFSLIIFNYFSQIRFNFSLLIKKNCEKKLPSTLDPRHGFLVWFRSVTKVKITDISACSGIIFHFPRCPDRFISDKSHSFSTRLFASDRLWAVSLSAKI